MKLVQLPSGYVLNLDLVTGIDPKPKHAPETCTVSFGHPDLDIALSGSDAEMIKAYCAKRPLLIPPARVPAAKKP